MKKEEQHKKDPMGHAIHDYWKAKKTGKLRVFSPMFDEDEMPLDILFRNYDNMPEIEQKALGLVKGKTLDVGAGAGCHSLVLQDRGIDVTAIDISPLSVETMRERGIKQAFVQDFFTINITNPLHTDQSNLNKKHGEGMTCHSQYETILMHMNGIGIVGTLDKMPEFFKQLDKILAPKGQLLCDSSDITYVFETEDSKIEYPNMGYFGEQMFQMKYKNHIGKPFPWLYIDAATLIKESARNGYEAEIIFEGKHFDYLARITKKKIK